MSFARSSRRFNNLKAKRRLARGLPATVQPRITRRRFVVENHLQDLDEWPILSEASRRMAIAHAFPALGYPDRDEWQCYSGTISGGLRLKSPYLAPSWVHPDAEAACREILEESARRHMGVVDSDSDSSYYSA